jgi:hypothetical protein
LPVLCTPADPSRLMARVLALLSPYFEKDVPQAVREIEADDWAHALAEYPEWAITAAVRWWKGPDNPKRARRPLEGDIAARCRVEMEAIRAVKIALQSGVSEPVEQPTPIPAETREQRQKAAAEIMASFASVGAAE